MELSLREILRFVHARAHVCALMTRKSCTVAMRNAILGNYLKLQESTKLRQPRTIQVYVLPVWSCFLDFIAVDWANISLIILPTTWAGTMESELSYSLGTSTAVFRTKNFPESHIINPLLIKLARSRVDGQWRRFVLLIPESS